VVKKSAQAAVGAGERPDGEAFQEAKRKARVVLHVAGVTDREHLVAERIAHAHNVAIVESELRGATAHLVRRAGRATILLGHEARRSVAHRNWAIAHELGHHVLNHPSVAIADLDRGGGQGGSDRSGPEAEANAFAAELLMPATLARRRCEVSPVSLDATHRLAREFEVPPWVAALRFAELTSERVAAVVCDPLGVRWWTASATFRPWLRVGRAIDRRSQAWQCVTAGATHAQPWLVPAAAWLGATVAGSIVEHALADPARMGHALALLWIPEVLAKRVRDTSRIK
jgi:Zn-dependent peptidase ImmA (M78 family)